MMKKEVKHLGISTSVVLMVMVVFGTLFSSCYTKDDIPVVPAPAIIPNTYLIQGSVLTSTGGVLENVKGVTITCAPKEVKNSVNDGNFLFYVEKPGTYTLTLVKAGYESIAYNVDVPEVKDVEGQLISVNVTLTMYKVTSLPTVKVILDPNKAATLTTTDGKASLAIDAKSVPDFVEISMGVSEEVVPAPSSSIQDAGVQFVYGQFGPSGLNFLKPITWSIKNPLTTYNLENTELQFRKDNVITWEPQVQAVIFAKNNYSVQLTHFSEYRIVYKASSSVLATDSIALSGIEKIVNEDQADKKIKEILYQRNEGAELTFGPEWDNLTADRENLEKLVRAAVAARLNIATFAPIVKKDATFILSNPITLAYDYHFLSKGVQFMNNYTFVFRVSSSAGVLSLPVTVKASGAVKIYGAAEFCGAHHTHGHCGHIFNGGAGGGGLVGE